MSMRLRFADADREAYGLPEVLEWSRTAEWLNDLPGDECIAVDETLRTQFPEVDGPLIWLYFQVQKRTADLALMRVGRAVAWLMARSYGCEVALEDFRPRLLGMKAEFPDADPPAGGEASSPISIPDGPEGSPDSETSTTDSDLGSANATQD